MAVGSDWAPTSEVYVVTTKRLILVVAVAVLIAACVNKAKSHRESEWQGLTESEARSKLAAKLPGCMPDDKRSAISDKVVAKMRDRGVIREDSDVTDDASEVPETADPNEDAGVAAQAAQH
jgi:hypothetical protein